MRRRLVLTAAAVTSMVVLAFLVPLALIVRDVVAERAIARAQLAAESFAPIVASGDPASIERERADVTTRLGYDVAVVGPDSTGDPLVTRARRGESFHQSVPGGEAVLTPVVAGGSVTVVRITVPNGALREGVAATWGLLVGLGVVLTVVAVVIADRLAVGVVRPVADLADTARRLEGGDLDARADPGGPPEVEAVGHAVNRLAVRVRELLDAEREAAADLAHRLRTPMTALRLDAEGLHDAVEAERLSADVDALARAVDQVIADARRPTREGLVAFTDMRAVVEERVAFWAALAEDQARTMRLDIDIDAARVRAPAADLSAAIDAVLGNVFAHTPEGTPFAVALRPAAGELVELVVDDAGPGLPPAALDRGVSAGGSTGLGLDIARRTAIAAGGGIEIGRSPDGGGRVALRFARAQRSE